MGIYSEEDRMCSSQAFSVGRSPVMHTVFIVHLLAFWLSKLYRMEDNSMSETTNNYVLELFSARHLLSADISDTWKQIFNKTKFIASLGATAMHSINTRHSASNF